MYASAHLIPQTSSVVTKSDQTPFYSNLLHPPGSSLPVCTCPPGYIGNGYGPTGCTQTSNICQTNNPCVNGQCVVSVCMRMCTGVKIRKRILSVNNTSVESYMTPCSFTPPVIPKPPISIETVCSQTLKNKPKISKKQIK